ncbi:MAG: MarR family winged helix-turn-helix transcriptional regulator [Bacteroidetes bacterium]|nr:MarR family winged helix-turn-helix transcriptional regulator [Bacteroidota bacterium]
MNQSDFNLIIQNQHIESKIIASFERIAQIFRVLLWQESKKYSLSPIQIQILIFLSTHTEDKRKVTYLANEFNMTKATISDAIKSLEQKELITKNYIDNDIRSYIIQLTTKGKNIANKTSVFTQQLHEPLSKLNLNDKENLLLNMLNIISHSNKNGLISVQRMCYTCSHFQTNNKKHICKLLNKELKNTELRLDCQEYKLKE